MKHLLVIGTLPFRELAFMTYARCGFKVTLIDGPSPYSHYGRLVDRYVLTDLTDRSSFDSIREQVAGIHRTNPVSGVVTLTSLGVELAALIASDLGLQGLQPGVASLAVDKYRVRCALKNAGLPSPYFEAVTSMNALSRVAAERGLPLVVKAADGGGSMGVTIVRDTAALATAYDLAMYYSDIEVVLIEEVMAGVEVSVEIASTGSDHFVVAVADKSIDADLVETGHTLPSMLSQTALEEAKALAISTARTIGVDTGVSHVEVMITKSGPVLVELNPRIAGGLIPDLICLAGGTNLYEWMATQAAGLPLSSPSPACRGCAGVRFLSLAGGWVERLPRYPELVGLLRDITDSRITIRNGQFLPPAVGNYRRVGYFMDWHMDPQELRSRLERVLQHFPLPREERAWLNQTGNL